MKSSLSRSEPATIGQIPFLAGAILVRNQTRARQHRQPRHTGLHSLVDFVKQIAERMARRQPHFEPATSKPALIRVSSY